MASPVSRLISFKSSATMLKTSKLPGEGIVDILVAFVSVMNEPSVSLNPTLAPLWRLRYVGITVVDRTSSVNWKNSVPVSRSNTKESRRGGLRSANEPLILRVEVSRMGTIALSAMSKTVLGSTAKKDVSGRVRSIEASNSLMSSRSASGIAIVITVESFCETSPPVSLNVWVVFVSLPVLLKINPVGCIDDTFTVSEKISSRIRSDVPGVRYRLKAKSSGGTVSSMYVATGRENSGDISSTGFPFMSKTAPI